MWVEMETVIGRLISTNVYMEYIIVLWVPRYTFQSLVR